MSRSRTVLLYITAGILRIHETACTIEQKHGQERGTNIFCMPPWPVQHFLQDLVFVPCYFQHLRTALCKYQLTIHLTTATLQRAKERVAHFVCASGEIAASNKIHPGKTLGKCAVRATRPFRRISEVSWSTDCHEQYLRDLSGKQ